MPTVLVQIPFAKSGEDVVGTVTLVIEAVQVLALIGSVILVEKALKRTLTKMATNADRVRDTAERRGGYMKADEVISRVVDLCREYDAKKVILYGSRAKGTAGERSDIDIAVSGVENFDELVEKVEELPTLYSVDLLNMDTCRNDLLMEDINNMDAKFDRRFQSFCNSLDALAEARERDLTDSFVLSGTSAKFSITFDLSWKVMKDILVQYYAITGFVTGSPRDVLREALRQT